MLDKITHLFLITKIFLFIKYSYKYIKDKSTIGKIFYSKDFINIIGKYLNVNLKTDWIGRQYGVINPLVDIKGNIDVNNVIVELDGDNTNNNEYVKNWIMKQLSLVGNLFKINGLYNFIDMDIRHVGPVGFDNYLIIFDIVSRKQMSKYFKQSVWQLLAYIITVICIFAFFI